MQQQTFDLYLMPDFSLQASSSVIEVLRLANETLSWEAYGWRLLTLDGDPLRSGCGTRIVPDLSWEKVRGVQSARGTDAHPVVCGGNLVPERFRPLEFWLRECRYRQRRIVAIGSGLYALARTGLAKGRRCAVHWEQFPAFTEAFPEITAVQTAFEIDDDLYTCPAGDAAFDMFLSIVERDFGRSAVNRICEKAIAHRVREKGERQRLPMQTRLGIGHQPLIAIVERMEAHIGEPMALERVVDASSLSRRQVERLFRRELGQSPARYYLNMRLERAQLLLRTSSLSVVEIAIACGFVSASHFSKTYRETYGVTPIETRGEAARGRRRRQDVYAET